MRTAALPTLTPADVTVTADHMGRLYALIPDDIARHLAAAANEGIDPEARGIHFESITHPADSWAAATVRTVFEAVLAVAPNETGLTQYRTHDGGNFYGFICGVTAWDTDACWWRKYGQHHDLIVRGVASIAHASRGALAGTCTF